MNACIELDLEQFRLLDEALRLAYTRLVDTDVARGRQFHQLRDPLVVPIVKAILRGETDPWRLARRGLFAACEVLAMESVARAEHQSSAAA
jgi:hypothetical protein